MRKLFLFSWEQLMKLVALFKPIIEIIREIIDIFKKNDDDNENH